MPGSTPVLGLPYPLMGEPVGPANFVALANAVDLALAAHAAAVTNDLQTKPQVVAGIGFGGTVAAGAETTLTMTTPSIDTAGMWNPAVPTRFTCQKSGVYMLGLKRVSVGSMTTQTAALYSIFVNAARIVSESRYWPSATATPRLSCRVLWPLFVGDIVEFKVFWAGTGGPANVLSAEMTAFYRTATP